MKHHALPFRAVKQASLAVLLIHLVLPLAGSDSTNTAPETGSSIPDVSSKTLPRTNTPARLDYASFRMIAEKNIFNPNRSPRSSSRGESAPRKVTKTETLSLLGTMSYEKGDVAFFGGSRSEFKKVLKPMESIAGFRIQRITFYEVSLTNEGKILNLPVGGKLRRQDDGPWELSASSEKGGTESSSSASESAGAGDGETSGGGESDVLKRLLKKREQETGKLRPQDDGPAELTPSSEKDGKASSPSTRESKGADEGESSAGGESELLKRLLKKREQETKNEKQ